ncbi:MAG: SPASM domain-containing protein [Proteobacteria bacterium]|nr:SPASM domain-containing protein [Pseudomonadota bacterium]
MTAYRLSQNRTITVDRHRFLFLADTNAIFEIDADTATSLERFSPDERLEKDEILSRLKGSSEDGESLFEELTERRVMVHAPRHEGGGKRVSRLPSYGLETLVLQVTESCNLGCLYCYHSPEKPSGKKRKMSLEVAQRSVDFLLEQCGQNGEVTLVFFGGEPFLNFDLISRTIEYARNRSNGSGKRVGFSLTTNGTLLSEKTLDFLYRNRVGLTVSMDGDESDHDRFRQFPGGASSYRVIEPKLADLFRIYRDIPVAARVTVARSPEHVPATLDHLLGLGFAEVGFAPVTTQEPRSRLDKDGMDDLLARFRQLSERFVRQALQGEFLGFGNLVDLLVNLHQGEVKDYPCGAGLGLFSVDPAGELFLCQRLTGSEPSHMGNVFDGFDNSKVEGFRKSANIDNKPECEQCWAKMLCAGGCYHEALVREGDMLSANRHYCQWIKNWVNLGLETYGRLAVDCPDYLDKLSLLRGHKPIFNTVV